MPPCSFSTRLRGTAGDGMKELLHCIMSKPGSAAKVRRVLCFGVGLNQSAVSGPFFFAGATPMLSKGGFGDGTGTVGSGGL